MGVRHSVQAISKAAQSVELSRLAREQTEAAILASLRLLRQPVYPERRGPGREQ